MKIIIPMAGRGSRLRPHTLTVPKPLLPIAGKPIVEHLVNDLAKAAGTPIEEVAYVIKKDFGEEIENKLHSISQSLGARSTIYYQENPMGTGDAVMCAAPSLSGPCIVGYADTLFRGDLRFDSSIENSIVVKKIDRPEDYGVVQLNEQKHITRFIEKPKKFVSDLAIIGVYYFKDGNLLKQELQKVLNEKLLRSGEYQINDGMEKMLQNGAVFVPQKVDHWMDCGNKKVAVETNNRMLQFLTTEKQVLIHDDIEIDKNSKINQPCYIGPGVILKNAKVGPNVSLGANTELENVKIKNSLVQNNSKLRNAVLENAMIGNHVLFDGDFTHISLGDYSALE